jgi:F-type H+-transporting ATPase subunit delta
MSKISRRSLANYGVDQLIAGKPAKSVAKQLVTILAEQGWLSQAAFLLDDISWELENRQALAVGKVTSAQPLSAKIQAELKAQIKQATGVKEVLLDSDIDKSVIGGIRLETSSRVWDSTVSRKLSELREVF